MIKLTGVVLAAVVLVGTAGCGGSDKKPLSKSEYVRQGNAICKKGNKKIEAAASKFKGEPSPKELEKFATDDLVPSVEDQVKQLRDLEPPKADKDTVEKIYKQVDAGVSKVKADPSTLTKTPDPFGKANKAARSYGLTVCGS